MSWYRPPPLHTVECAVHQLQHGENKAWDEYVYRCPEASHCHLSGWRRVMERSYGHRASYLWARDNGEIKGILPLIRMRSFPLRRSETVAKAPG